MISFSNIVTVQLLGTSIQDYDRLIDLENAVSELLMELGAVDGHDMGQGEMNIFVYCEHPEQVFTRIKPLLDSMKLLDVSKIAYRKIDGEEYSVMWPPGESEFSII